MLTHCLVKLSTLNLPRYICRHFYDWKTCNETIFAVATAMPHGKGSPLSIVRLSGPMIGRTIESIAKLKLTNTDASGQYRGSCKIIEPRKAKLAKLYDPNDAELIDVGLVLWFPKPNSYTGEDVCEFHVHGSQAILSKFLKTLGKIEGLRPAEPGEFTYRAYKNKKMSLMQIESLSDLISSQTDHQRRLALKGLTDTTKEKYEHWIGTLVKVLAHLEASIDFGEDELLGEQQVVEECIQKLRYLSDEIHRFILVGSRCRDFIKSGARVAIIGKPNSGKSTIMNLLCQRDKSIVSDLSGTTRDTVEHCFELGGHTVTMSDTAGLKDLANLFLSTHQTENIAKKVNDIRQTEARNNVIEQHDKIEREGIKRALKAAQDADMILYMYDASQSLSTADIADELSLVLSKLIGSDRNGNIRAVHLVINKIDLKNDLRTVTSDIDIDTDNCDDLRENFQSRLNSICDLDHFEITMISCKTQKNLDVLIGKLSSSLDRLLQYPSSVNTNNNSEIRETLQRSDNVSSENRTFDYEYLNERHLSLLSSVHRHLSRASGLNIKTIDEMAQHVRESVDYLSRIVGSVTNEQVLDIIFRDFCIGK